MQIVTIRPRVSNVIEPQSPLSDAENVWAERPSGPPHTYPSVCHASLWISERPLGAMKRLRGVEGIPRTGCGRARLPANTGDESPDGIGVAATATVPLTPSAAAITINIRRTRVPTATNVSPRNAAKPNRKPARAGVMDERAARRGSGTAGGG